MYEITRYYFLKFATKSSFICYVITLGGWGGGGGGWGGGDWGRGGWGRGLEGGGGVREGTRAEKYHF